MNRSLRAYDRIELLHHLCEWRFLDYSEDEEVSMIPLEKLRVSPLGTDRNGAVYWHFSGVRLYRESSFIYFFVCILFEGPPKKRKSKEEKSEGPNSWSLVCSCPADWVDLAAHVRGDAALARNLASLLPRMQQHVLKEVQSQFSLFSDTCVLSWQNRTPACP